MPEQEKILKLKIGGMTCVNCQNRIKNALLRTKGVKSAIVSYQNGTAEIAYLPDRVTPEALELVVEHLQYTILRGTGFSPRVKRTAGLLLVIAVLYLVLDQTGVLNLLVPSQLAQADMGYGMLFVIGLITSVHCVAMCGGINLSQSLAKKEAGTDKSRFTSLLPGFLYNAGRVLSYTAVGFVVGGLGSVFAFSTTVQGILKLIAGIFMVLMGINMLGLFPQVRRFLSAIPHPFARKVGMQSVKSKSPLLVGLLNGLMPCGPLQAMQLYALSTASPFKGALSMLLFSLGTLPLMLGLSTLGSLLAQKHTRKVMTAGAVLVAVLGLSMFTQGWNLTGWSQPLVSADTSSDGHTAVDAGDGGETLQVVKSELSRYKYPSITVRKGTPVEWIISADEDDITGCNYVMVIPEYEVEYGFAAGENMIEFTPEDAGTYSYTCWMGMLRGTITVTEA